ncbi:DUF455 family protein [Synoicihabitans lomoniglobus]|uniref:DUF455 family protein n=1 Tax=Synoicihabitans lomoniglobus TaxID=2909285 RepID=A0AAE9ZVV4_9BACT|nr:DUF455 family protein [Opitutaceae bacterium LMO-M01]WED65067.1 DUF455 family protein [Opitutaceae bacterium LMO-M01]
MTLPESTVFPPAALRSHQINGAKPESWSSQTIASGVTQLTTLFALQRELVRSSAAWLAGVPYWDAKEQLARHILADARAAEAVLQRLHELKASGVEHQQVAGVQALGHDLACAPHGDAWLRAHYRVVKPALIAELTSFLQRSDPVMDAPTHDVIRHVRAVWQTQVSWFVEFTPSYSAWEYADDETANWESRVKAVMALVSLDAADFYPRDARLSPGERSADFEGIARVRRDKTCRLANDTGFPREGATFEQKRFLVFYNHTQEMQFAESLGEILYETVEMPWAFHLDLARHLADEVRHAGMGVERLRQLGVELTEIPMQTQHYKFRTNMSAMERFCLMTLVMEATAFERKRANVELFESHGDEVSLLYETYDIRDEMLHTNLGHVWVPILLRVYHDARSVKALTEHCRGLIAQVITTYPANAANMVRR